MSDRSSLERAVKIFQKGGELIVSPDVYDAMLGLPLQELAKFGRVPRVSDLLPKNSIFVANFGAVGLKSPWKK